MYLEKISQNNVSLDMRKTGDEGVNEKTYSGQK